MCHLGGDALPGQPPKTRVGGNLQRLHLFFGAVDYERVGNSTNPAFTRVPITSTVAALRWQS